MSTDWVKTETNRHSQDELSYSRVILEEWYVCRDNVLKRCERLMSTICQFIVPSVARFLRSYDHFVTPAKFYVISKIHKMPMVSRPIAASRSYITRPLSIFVDELVKLKIQSPTVFRDSRELILLLENTVLPSSNCLLVTMDVVSLYPNVDHKKVLVALYLLLQEACAPETPLLVQLARLILENNYLSSKFSPGIFHQDFSIAMGTPFAVTIANTFMYYHNKDIIEQYSNYLFLYWRFIDDIFAI